MLTPKDKQTTTTQSDKLPTHLQPLHHIRPARPSMGSQELGSDISGQKPKTPGSLQINLLFTIYAEQASGQKPMQTCIFFKRQTRRSQPVSLDTNRFGGAERDRTADPLLAKQVLSQLSYSPISSIARYKPGSATFRISHIPSSPTLIRKCKWWAREDLNFRPHAYQACALTN